MTNRQTVEKEIISCLNILDSRVQSLVDVILDDEFDCMSDTLSLLREHLDRLTKVKCGSAKIFIAIDGDTVNIEGSIASVDVILTRLPNPVNKLNLLRETLVPLSEAAFLEVIHDTLADQIQRGSISPLQINQTIE